MPPRVPPFISQRTVGRRKLLEWLGKGTVLALGSPLLKACAALDDSPVEPDDVPAADRADGGTGDVPPAEVGADGAADAAETGADGGAGKLTFEPGSTADSPIFEGWGERTVDPQDIRQILADWRLTVDGLVERPREFTFEELLELSRQDQVTDFHCVEGWSIYDVPWNGVHISTLAELVRPLPTATHVAFYTVDYRYNESLPRAVAIEPRTMLAYGVDGRTLPLSHGFPLRAVVPRLLAYKSAKYVQRVSFTDEPVYGYWVRAGYPYDAEVPEGRLRPGRY
jgi:DMSO/TMAO reductase YedYZ molybdopterin-dependent catalytic subunit